MSQPTSPPPHQMPGGDPYAQGAAPQPPVQGAPPQPYAPFPQQQGVPAAPPAPAGPIRDNLALGLLAAVVAALVTAGIYGAIVGSTKHEIGYAAVGVGFLVGFASGKAGGRNPALPVVAALLSLGAVYLGELMGYAVILGDLGDTSVTTVLTEHLGVVNRAWQEEADVLTFVFFAIGAAAAFSGAKKAAG